MPTSRFRQFFDTRMIKALTAQASRVAEQAKENASWSKSIPDAISVGKAEKTSSGFKVDVVIDLNKAPHAAAFEYGSGLHGEKGEKYTIQGMPWLAIPRERWPKYAPPPDVDPVVLSKVEHPGVKAEPYMKPAIEQHRNRIREALGKVFKSAYLDSTVRVTVISAEK